MPTVALWATALRVTFMNRNLDLEDWAGGRPELVGSSWPIWSGSSRYSPQTEGEVEAEAEAEEGIMPRRELAVLGRSPPEHGNSPVVRGGRNKPDLVAPLAKVGGNRRRGVNLSMASPWVARSCRRTPAQLVRVQKRLTKELEASRGRLSRLGCSNSRSTQGRCPPCSQACPPTVHQL